MSLLPPLPPSSARNLAAVGRDANHPAIRRNVEGGIDFDSYLVKARRLRSQAIGTVLRSFGQAIGSAFATVAKALRERRQRRRALAELLSLDDRGLRDLGLNRAGVYFAIEHGREDVANANERPIRSPHAA